LNSKYKTDLKAWLRKYPTPEQQRKHPFLEFKREVNVFEILKYEIKEFLKECNIQMHTKTNPDGNLSVSHYMTLLQKLTSVINKQPMINYFPLSIDYDFNIDYQHIKKAHKQKEYKAYLTQISTENSIRSTNLIVGLSHHTINRDILNIFKYINDLTGDYKPITYKAVKD
jgi:hypothetical protein